MLEQNFNICTRKSKTYLNRIITLFDIARYVIIKIRVIVFTRVLCILYLPIFLLKVLLKYSNA